MDRLRIDTLELLESRYRTQAPVELTALFEAAYASKQRQYAKRLLGAGREAEARKQLRASLARSQRILSTGKSIGWLIASYMPGWLQPTWPSAQREWRE
jgi:hypothetical protein